MRRKHRRKRSSSLLTFKGGPQARYGLLEACRAPIPLDSATSSRRTDEGRENGRGGGSELVGCLRR